jgi:APA family basic amino acid/polyamine antiporter
LTLSSVFEVTAASYHDEQVPRNLMTGARIPFAMSRDRCFFPALAQVHPRFRTPSTAIVVQSALAVAVMLAA